VITKARRARARCCGEQGETLIELLVAMGILAIAITVIVASMATAIALASRHREQAEASTYLVTAVENVKRADYAACDGAPSYDANAPRPLDLPKGWTVDASHVQALDESGHVADCPTSDTKLEQVLVTITGPTGYRVQTTVVKRDDR
jgi:type II secretory pathway pseudopilin PulG